MKKLVAVVASLLVLAACGGSDDPSPAASDTTTGATSTETPNSTTASGGGVPDGFAYPPGAELTELAPKLIQYSVASTTVDDIKAYWVTYFESQGFTKYNEANASVFYEKGALKMQATYAQFDADVKGTVKVLSN